MISIPTVHWCIGVSSSIKSKPIKKKIAGKTLTIFRTKNGSIKAINDVCPHRGASLSQGKIKNDCIECPYHGWIFDEYGILKKIPANGNKSLPKNGNTFCYELQEYNNFVWLLTKKSNHSIPELKEFQDDNYTKLYGESEVKGNWIDWISNGLDISHINFVHDFADENDGEVSDIFIEYYPNKVQCKAKVNPKATSFTTQSLQSEKSQVTAEFYHPNTNIIRITLKDPYKFVTYTSITPISENRSLMSWCFAYNLKFNKFVDKFFEYKFRNAMYKTIKEDEEIIKNLKNMSSGVNAKCDFYGLKGLEKISEYLYEHI
jgi:phenylpropionate dioxygenase-like ring-hydroxylating dioxygenase large terminal subunit